MKYSFFKTNIYPQGTEILQIQNCPCLSEKRMNCTIILDLMDFSNLILKVLCFYEKSIVTYTAAATPFLPAREITHANPELFLTFEKTALYNKSTQNGVSVQ